MATKPIVSFTFATDALVTGGPANGFPLKIAPGTPARGHIPGDPIVAEYVNYYENITGDWTVWLLAGTYDPDLDAHLVETDADGFGSMAQLTLGGTSAALQALIVTQNTGAQSSSIFAENTGTGFAMTASAVGSVAAVRGVGTGTGPGLEGLASGTNNVGVKGTGQGTAAGGQFTGGATGPGLTATAGATGDYGAVCTGVGAFAGLYATGGSTGNEAILGEASIGSQDGVHGKTSAAATTAACGVRGEGLGSADGVRATAESGYALYAQGDSTAPQRASMRVGPQNADPVTGDTGAWTHRSDIDIPRVYTDSLWQSPWTTARGHAHGLANPRTSVVTNGDDATYVDLSTLTMASPYEPRFASGSVVLFASARFGDADSNFHHHEIDVQIIDVTAGATVYDARVCTGPSVVDASVDGKAISQWSAYVPYTIPSAGARQFTLRFKPATTLPDDAVADMSSLIAVGVFG
jgi:hypothetical protein